MKVAFYRHGLNEDDIDQAAQVLRSLFLTTGDVTRRFESLFAQYLGVRNVVGVMSGTAALHLALLAWGIGPGDEVITTPMTFCATANTVLHAGATPIFVDVEADTGNLDAARVEAAVTPRTRAIVAVHLYGQMCDMRALRTAADRHGLILIEDAAHAVEAERDGIRPGVLSDAACFSFYATKNLTSGEGGAAAINDDDRAKRLVVLRQHGMDASAADRYTGQYRHYDMTVLGWKANLDNIKAALLVSQLPRLAEALTRREAIVRRYAQGLADAPGVDLIRERPGIRHGRHLFTILAPQGRRDDLLAELQARGVGVAVNYRAVHLLAYYRERFGYRPGLFPNAEAIGDRTLTLPLYPSLSDEDVEYVIESVREGVASLG